MTYIRNVVIQGTNDSGTTAGTPSYVVGSINTREDQ